MSNQLGSQEYVDSHPPMPFIDRFDEGRASVLIDQEPMRTCVKELFQLAKHYEWEGGHFSEQRDGLFCLYAAAVVAKHMIPAGTAEPIE